MKFLERGENVDRDLRAAIVEELKGLVNQCCEQYMRHDAAAMQTAQQAKKAFDKIVANTEITLQTDRELEKLKNSIREQTPALTEDRNKQK